MSGPLDSVKLKLVRAQEHLAAVLEVLGGASYGKCEIIPEENPDANLGVLRVRLPKVPDTLSPLIGDFLFNVRSALDHVVWQLVLANGGTPTKATCFPISSDPGAFAKHSKTRLAGVSPKASALIETLQPYHGGNEPLGILARLHNVDKHQTFNLITAVASDTLIDWTGANSSLMQMFLGDEELRNGAVFGDIGIALDNPDIPPILLARFHNMEVEGLAAIFIAFDEPSADELEPWRVDSVLQEIFDFVRDSVVPAFEPFFN